jgi:succinate dehydrogenase / fumarate reductase flavoprotein subunit
MWDYCGMSRNAEGLEKAVGEIRAQRDEFWQSVNVPGSGKDLNMSLEHALRVVDFFDLAELMCIDARQRDESCGAHFRVESQTAEGEAKRDDSKYCYVSAWLHQGQDSEPALIKEPLKFETVSLVERSYK